MDQLLGELPPLQRAALTLFYYEDRPVAEIARMLDLPENTVKTHMSRGRAALREAYERDERVIRGR
jgi:RNA polymerase sigma-70 factor (ECF subfamily)